MNNFRHESAGRSTGPAARRRAPMRRPLSLALAAALSAGPALPVDAATRVWTGVATTQWSNGNNWNALDAQATLFAPPTDGDALVFNNTQAPSQLADIGATFASISFGSQAAAFVFNPGQAIGVTAGISNGSAKAQTFHMGVVARGGDQSWDGGSAGLTLSNMGMAQNLALTLTRNVSVTQQAGAVLGDAAGEVTTLNILGGSSSLNQALTLGRQFGSQGTVLVDGAASRLTSSGDLVVGQDSTGVVTVQNGGTLNTANSFVGNGLSGDGLVTLAGKGSSWVSNGSLSIGEVGVGRLQVQSGALLISNNATLGRQAGSLGLAQLTGAASIWIDHGLLQVGKMGQGFLSVDQGALLLTQNAAIGAEGDPGTSFVSVTGTGSLWQAAGELWVTSGTLSVTDGGLVAASHAYIGKSAGSSAVVNLSGAGSTLTLSEGLDIGAHGTLNLGVGATLNTGAQFVLDAGGVLNLNGGTLNIGWANTLGKTNWNAGTVNFLGTVMSGNGLLPHTFGLGAGMTMTVAGTLAIQAGDLFSVNGGQVHTVGLTLLGDVGVDSFSTLSVGADGVGIEGGALELTGGTITSEGRIRNGGSVSGYGVIAGVGGFSNSGLLQQGAGTLVLGATGGNDNTGTWALMAGRTLRLDADLQNEGAFQLNGGSVTGNGTLLNGDQGTISGSGRIAAGSFLNLGTLVVGTGQTRIDPSFVNRGQILLGDNAAALSGGQIGNHGVIQGFGRINNNISSIDAAGSITAQGGTLTLNGAIVSANAGLLAANSGATLLINQGLASNAGRVQLAGGTLDNNGHALSNEVGATISGFGTLRGGLLTNNGRVLLSGGTSAIYAQVLSTAGSQIVASGNSNTTFYAPVDIQSGAELRVSTGSVATFFELVQQRTGARFTGAGAKRFEGGVTVGASPGLGTDEGDVEFGDSNTYFAEIGGTTACTLACGTDDALKNRSYDKYIVAGSLTFGGALKLTSWNGFVAQAGQRFDLFDWGSTSGSFSSIDASGLQLAANTKLDFSSLYTTGEIVVTTSAVPEPESYALLLGGLGVIGFVGRRRRPS